VSAGARTVLRAVETRVRDEPCDRKCRHCSRCIRYTAAWRNKRLSGRPDYVGRRGLLVDQLELIP
jgi:hypothetical protein